MIYKFRSKAAGDLIMLGPHGDQIMRILGREPAPKGIDTEGVVRWKDDDSEVALFGAAPDVAENARTYLTISMWGLPAMLVVFAATGLLRGMQDTVTPLWIAGLGFGANAALNALFIYGFGWGIAGSAIGTVVAQWGMVAAYAVVVGRLARKHAASVLPQREGVRGSAEETWRRRWKRYGFSSVSPGFRLHEFPTPYYT